MGSELVRFAAVMTGVHAAARAFGDVSGQQRVGGGGRPPGGPALGVSAGETPLVLAPPQGQVEPGQGGRLLLVEGEVIAVEQQATRAGFAEVGTLWQRGDNRLLCAVLPAENPSN